MTGRTALWRPLDRAAVALGNFAGLALVVAAYAGAGHEVTADRQTGWVELGIAGLLVVAVANTGWLLAGRRACWRLRHSLLPAGPGMAWPTVAEPGSGTPGRAAPGPALPTTLLAGTAQRGELVAGAVMTWYHAPTCPMAAGREVVAAGEAEHRAQGRRPCGICLPAPTGPGERS
jgi:hypothetical protein